MGQHDPLNGFVAYGELQMSATTRSELLELKSEIADMAEICWGINLVTDYPPGIGRGQDRLI